MTQGIALVAAPIDLEAGNTRRAVDDLGKRFRRGDPGAFEDVVRLYQAQVTHLAFRLLGWRDDEVQDVVQEVFLAAFHHARRFRGDARMSTWLTSITVNKCRSHRRSWMRRWGQFFAGAPVDPLTPNAPVESVVAQESAARVRAAVQALGPRDREVVVLRYFEQLPLEEIGRVTGQSKNAVEVRLHRARAKLAAALGEQFENE